LASRHLRIKDLKMLEYVLVVKKLLLGVRIEGRGEGGWKRRWFASWKLEVGSWKPENRDISSLKIG
jgi:hypothetical protein